MSYSHEQRKKAIKNRKNGLPIINQTTGEECNYRMIKGVWKLIPIKA